MDKFEIMRKVICGLCIWNLILTTGLLINIGKKQEEKLNQQICILENIPPLEVITEEF